MFLIGDIHISLVIAPYHIIPAGAHALEGVGAGGRCPGRPGPHKAGGGTLVLYAVTLAVGAVGGEIDVIIAVAGIMVHDGRGLHSAVGRRGIVRIPSNIPFGAAVIRIKAIQLAGNDVAHPADTDIYLPVIVHGSGGGVADGGMPGVAHGSGGAVDIQAPQIAGVAPIGKVDLVAVCARDIPVADGRADVTRGGLLPGAVALDGVGVCEAHVALVKRPDDGFVAAHHDIVSYGGRTGPVVAVAVVRRRIGGHISVADVYLVVAALNGGAALVAAGIDIAVVIEQRGIHLSSPVVDVEDCIY